MGYELSEDQQLLKDGVERLAAEQYSFEQRRKHAAEPPGWSRAMWARYAEMGLLGLPLSQDYGGHGGDAQDVAIVMEAFGRALALEPYLATVVLGAGALQAAGSAAQKQALLPAVARGELLLALAHAEPQSRYDLADVASTARRSAGGWQLDGEKAVVIHGDCADRLLVSARVAGRQRDPEGIGLFLVPRGAPGLETRAYLTQDGQRAANLRLNAVAVPDADCIGEPGAAFPVIEQVIDQAIAATCAEAVGVLETMHAITVDYLKTRRQFGVPIGSFQALQHRAVDMLLSLDQARSMALYAGMMAGGDAIERRKAASAAKVQIGRSARFIGQQSIQLHGGIGLTYEYKVGHYFLRSTAIEYLFGDADHHLMLLARAGGLISADD